MTTAFATFPVTKVSESKLKTTDFNNLVFGKHFTDYMLEADYDNGEWVNVEIKPYQPISFYPSMAALHYGQAIFEGIKAYKHADGSAYIFRPYDNFKRFNISAKRMQMPEVPEEIFMDGLRQLVKLERDWIPTKQDYSLYIRPVMFATDEVIGVHPSNSYKFFILLSPTGFYYGAPMKILVEETYTRAAPGGVGFAKNAGNYGASLQAAQKAKEMGYDQVLWTDAFEHKWLQEVGTMNVFFVIDNVAITPPLHEGTILAGITRDSAIQILNDMGLEVEERNISIDELIAAYEAGKYIEAFGTGTAATVSYIKELRYKDDSMYFDTAKWKVAPELRKRVNDIREGRAQDIYGWLMAI
ncbi:MAG: branched-chain amino acid aminotransferase [Bacteroidota bacterium]|nr:branched-chain amino acid aminotransferase [Bacteroidota bacterium]